VVESLIERKVKQKFEIMTEGYLENGVYWRHNGFWPGRETMIFVHGLSGSSSAWIPYEQKFGKKFNLLFFDLRGHGKSVKKADGDYYVLENISGDIAALAERFKLQKFILVGHSLGAILAMDFARRHKKKVSRLILLAPNYRANKTWRAKIVNFFLLFAGITEPMPFEERIGVHIDYRRFFGTGDWDAGRMYADIRNTSLKVYYRCLREAKKFDGEKFIAGMDMPVLIVHGRKDTIFPAADSARLAKKMPNARLEILPDANHILVLNNFRETGKIMEDFLFNPPR